MSAIVELNPETAKQILIEAKSKGVSVEIYLKEIIRSEDGRIGKMREAMNDELFLADLEEVKEDFRHTDFE